MVRRTRHTLLLLTGLLTLLTSSVLAQTEQFVPISLTGLTNANLQRANPIYPQGIINLGDVAFEIGSSTRNNIWGGAAAAGNSAQVVTLTVPINLPNVVAVNTLINTTWGQPAPNSYASLTFQFSDNTSFTKPLYGNSDIRDYYNGGWINTINGTTTKRVFFTDVPGHEGAGRYRLDKQFIEMGAFAGKTLTSITITDRGQTTFQRLLVTAITVSTASVSGAVVSGHITLQNAVNQAQPLTFEFRPTDATQPFVRAVTLNADRTFSLAGIPRKAYHVRIKGAKWLAKVLTVDTTNGDVSEVNTTLRAGDANNDNAVDIVDLLLLIAHYNQVSPNAGYVEAADSNCDGITDIVDLLLLIGNYNMLGDS